MDEINNDTQDIEKPKKQISEAQKRHMQEMREKKKALSILNKDKHKKNIEKYANAYIAEKQKEKEIEKEKKDIDLIKLSDELTEIKKHLEDMKKMKEEKKKLKDAIDIKTTEEKKDNYDELLYKQQLMKNFLK
jgi:hypothetical protein